MSEIVKTTAEDANKIIRHTRRPSKYADILDSLKGLKPNEALIKKFPKGVDVRALIKSLTTRLSVVGDVRPPKGFGFFKSVGEDNQLVIRVLPRKAAKRSSK